MAMVPKDDETCKRIPLGHTGKYAIVDAADYDWLSQWKWYAGAHTCYARRSTGTRKQQGTVYMHRAIMEAPASMQVDHINHNTLDNRRANLRLVTPSQNHQNKRKVSHFRGQAPLSTYKGIQRHRRQWRAAIEVQGQRIMGRPYADPLDAAREYDELARMYFGEHALLNFGDDCHD